MTFNTPIKDAFPFIKQIISDTFMTDTYYISAPYADLDKLDRGFRQLLLHKENIAGLLLKNQDILKERMFIVHSTLGFYNVVALLPTENAPDLICLGPFLDRRITPQALNQITKSHHFPQKHLDVIRNFYDSLPTVDLQNITITLRHLLSAFLPRYEKVSAEYISFSSNEITEPAVIPNDDHIYSFTADESELYCQYLENFIFAMLKGKSEEAGDKLKLLLDYAGYNADMPLNQLRRIAGFLNSFCLSRMMGTRVHPAFLLKCHTSYEYRIETAEYQQLLQIPYELCRKYCLMVKNFNLPEYSGLICNIMNYVTAHISEEMTLSSIAAFFHKNPSYVSGRFRKETGESLTDFIQKERMAAAVRYFNTTSMSVAEVAGNVGISDFAYFSRIFKKHVGSSPNEYKKMVNP